MAKGDAPQGRRNNGTKVLNCSRTLCKSGYQDEHYGKGNRVHNGTKSGWKCTHCGNERAD